MTHIHIPYQRLQNQSLTTPFFEKAEDVVAWLGAVQAQDYSGAKWALGQRTKGLTDADMDRAFNEGKILRTHVMRPTWHFVTPADIRWMLALTAPRVHAVNAYMYRKAELDETTFKRCHVILEKTLQGGQQRTRDELRVVFEHEGISTTLEFQMTYLVMQAELEGIICSGPRHGKQFTYMLLAERVPQARILSPDEALAEFTLRYFTGHGPATVKDFSWWSGLTVADVRRGLDTVQPQLVQEEMDGQTYWYSASMIPAEKPPVTAYLLPNYDEYGISYREHGAMFDPENLEKLAFPHLIILDGRLVGTWKRTLKKHEVIIETNFFDPITEAENRAVVEATQKFGAFLGLAVVMM